MDQEELEGVPKPGDVVVEKYRVEKVLGVGGMGCVVAATHTDLGQLVAIKFLLAEAAKNPKNIERFKREAQAAARIRSDHVAKVTDIGTMADGTPYMVMEHLEGEDLSDRLQRGGIAIPEACRLLLEACEALAEAHHAGIVHRDLKPANLFLVPHPRGGERVKVLDFGISKILGPPGAGADLTKTSALMGSPLYMSPEQMMSAKDADARADIWALGVILYEMITCRPPFIGDTLPEICGKILTAAPKPLDEALPGTPPTLAQVIAGALAKKPEERYPTLAEFAVALAPFAGPQGQASAEVVCRTLDRHPASSQQAMASSSAAMSHATPSGGSSGPAANHGTPVAYAGQPAHAAAPSGHQPAAASAAQSHHGSHDGAISHGGPQATPSHGQPTVPSGTPAGAQTMGSAGQVPHHTQVPATVPAVVPHAAMAPQFSNTAAPVAQTMNEEPPRKRRGLKAAIAVVAFIFLGAAVIGLARKRGGKRGGKLAAPPAAAAPAEAPAPTPKATTPPAAATPEVSPDVPDTSTLTDRATKRRLEKLKKKLKNKVKKQPPAYKPKQGDDQFN